MTEVTSRHMEGTFLTPDYNQMPAVALQLNGEIGFGDDNLWQCGELQTAYHIANDFKSKGPPCNPTNVDNLMLI